jgi:hypothetical protein
VIATKKGINILDRGHQVNAMAEFPKRTAALEFCVLKQPNSFVRAVSGLPRMPSLRSRFAQTVPGDLVRSVFVR